MKKQKIESILEHAEQIKKILFLLKTDDHPVMSLRAHTIQSEADNIIELAKSLRDNDGIR